MLAPDWRPEPGPSTPAAPIRLSDAALLLLPPPPVLRARGSALLKVLQALGPAMSPRTAKGRSGKAAASRSDQARAGARARVGAVRCAIYTRKSSEEGLEQDFNSLHAQRERTSEPPSV